MSRRSYIARAAAFLSAGAYTVHQARYHVGFGADAEQALHHHGHGYLAVIAPVVTLLLAAAVGHVLWSALRPAGPNVPAPRFRRVWLLAAVCLLGVYTTQELVESLLAAHHPSGFTGVFGNGGWAAVPLSIAVGGVVALALRVAHAVDRSTPPRVIVALRLPALAELPTLLLPEPVALAPSSPLARNGAGRAPPRGR